MMWKKFKLFWRELGNVLFNILTPVVSMIIAIAELLQLPASFIDTLKKIEYWTFYACGTKQVIDKIIEKVDEAVADDKITKDEALAIGSDIKKAADQIVKDIKK